MSSKLDELVKSLEFAFIVIPANAGIQCFQWVLDSGACPGLDPGFAGVTQFRTFYESNNLYFAFFASLREKKRKREA